MKSKAPIKKDVAIKLMKDNGLTQQDLADEAGISQGAVSHFINGYSTSKHFWTVFFRLTKAA
jgi:predicted transcriptional regulator